jgi:hypothetical protein
MVKFGVLFEVRTEFLNNIYTSFVFKALNSTSYISHWESCFKGIHFGTDRSMHSDALRNNSEFQPELIKPAFLLYRLPVP